MQGRSALDEFPQFAVLTATGIAAATGVVINQLVTGITSMQKVAWEVSRIEYEINKDLLQVIFNSDQDEFHIGITQSNAPAQDITLQSASLIDKLTTLQQNDAVPATRFPTYWPVVHEFSAPRLVLPQSLFAIMVWDTTLPLVAEKAIIRIWYREREVTKEDWYDLLQLRLPLGAA